MKTLSGKTAVITGGSRGIGHAIALKMASEGANIAILYAGNKEAAQKTITELLAFGIKAQAYQCDVADADSTSAICKEILNDFTSVQILVNNAGITRDGLLRRMKEEDLDAVLDTNLKGAFHMIEGFYGTFLRAREGRIINISSVVGLSGNGGQTNYSAAKAGLIGLTKSVAKELGSRNITCNAIAPGFVETDMTASLPEKVREETLSSIPLKRMAQPEDIADAAAFLAGPHASYITGVVLRVDGGMCM